MNYQKILHYLILSLLTILLLLPTQTISSTDHLQVGASPFQITEEELATITNPTILDFAIYAYETDASLEDVLALSHIPRDGRRFVALGKHFTNEPPVLGSSQPGYEGVVTVFNGVTYDTTNLEQSTTYSELEAALQELYYR